jgi:hypothetical protein
MSFLRNILGNIRVFCCSDLSEKIDCLSKKIEEAGIRLNSDEQAIFNLSKKNRRGWH